MAAKLVLAPEAAQDLTEAYAWYEAQRIGLGEEFLTYVDACIESISVRLKVTQSFKNVIVARWFGDFRMLFSMRLQQTQQRVTAYSTRRAILKVAGAPSLMLASISPDGL